MNTAIDLTRDIATVLALRRVVFIDEQGISEADELDDLDAASLHLLAMAGAQPVGTARIHVTGDIAEIGRVCVLQSHRGFGVGAALIRQALAVARAQPGVCRAKLGAQVHALEFYERLGFHVVGPVYVDAGIDHRDMMIDL